MVSTAGSYCFANMVAICGETDFPNGILGYLILGHIQLSEFGGYQSSFKLESFVNGPERLIPKQRVMIKHWGLNFLKQLRVASIDKTI